MQNVSNTDSLGSVVFEGKKGDIDALVSFLTSNGIPNSDAQEFASAVKTETPKINSVPFDAKAKKWIGENIKKAIDGTWKVGIGVATDVLSKGALAYYGLDTTN